MKREGEKRREREEEKEEEEEKEKEKKEKEKKEVADFFLDSKILWILFFSLFVSLSLPSPLSLSLSSLFQVTLEIELSDRFLSDLSISLVSPMGTRSHFLSPKVCIFFL